MEDGFYNLNICDIKDGLYSINKYTSEIKNNKTGKILKTRKDKDGYITIGLATNSSKTKWFKIHRLMAIMFIPQPDKTKNVVNHKNGIKDDNRIENLEWVTIKENIRHARETGLHNGYGENHVKAKYTEEQIHMVCKLLEKGYNAYFIQEYIKYKTNQFIDKNTIHDIKRKKIWTHISDQYNVEVKYSVPKFAPKGALSFEEVIKICELIKDGKTNTEIYKILFDGKNKKKYTDYISKIRNNHKYRSVSSLYW